MSGTPSAITWPRYSDFAVPRIVDETLREGVERCMFPVDSDRLFALLRRMVDAGLREFVVGSGPEDPELYVRLCRARDSGELPPDVMPTFLVLLNCWDATLATFRKIPRSWIAETTFSFGMIPHKQEERLFERVLQEFMRLGAQHLKVSILNNFSRQIDDRQYAIITKQIDWAYSLGIRTIRINDSVGKLYPEATAELCRALVSDYPDVVFCLHCHNDRGLALANQLVSIYNGFSMVEGSLCGYGNRSGISPIEMLVPICQDKNITLGQVPIGQARLCEAAQLAEETFLQVPAVFRPVSGRYVKKANFGVLNIPDFLEADGERDYFLNILNIHPNTIRKALRQGGLDRALLDNREYIDAVGDRLRQAIEARYQQQVAAYDVLNRSIADLYEGTQMSVSDLVGIAVQVAEEHGRGLARAS